MATPSLSQARLVDLPLTNLAQGYSNAEYVMRLLYPLVDVATYGGQLIQFDESAYEEVDDARADDTPYPEIDLGYAGKPFRLNTRGLRHRVGDKLKRQYGAIGMNWGQIATQALMSRASLRHETEAAVAATTLGNYATGNRITLPGGSQFNDTATDPIAIIQMGKDAVSGQIAMEPNVGVMGQDTYSRLLIRYANVFRSTEGIVRANLAESILANILGLEKIVVCRAIVNRLGVKQRVFGKHLVLAYVRPEALNVDRLTYQIDGSINAFAPNFGYTYVYQGNPLVYEPWFDNDRKATVYDLDFDRVVANVGTNDAGLLTHGYLIQNAVA